MLSIVIKQIGDCDFGGGVGVDGDVGTDGDDGGASGNKDQDWSKLAQDAVPPPEEEEDDKPKKVNVDWLKVKVDLNIVIFKDCQFEIK